MKNLILVLCLVVGGANAQAGYAQAACDACDGKVTNLLLRHLGNEKVWVQIDSKKGVTLHEGYVERFGVIAVAGIKNFVDRKQTLGPDIVVYVDGQLNAQFHTSCSVPVGPGTRSGDFVVLAGTSRNAGLLCPVAPIPPLIGD